jgi:hypothetical protein
VSAALLPHQPPSYVKLALQIHTSLAIIHALFALASYPTAFLAAAIHFARNAWLDTQPSHSKEHYVSSSPLNVRWKTATSVHLQHIVSPVQQDT